MSRDTLMAELRYRTLIGACSMCYQPETNQVISAGGSFLSKSVSDCSSQSGGSPAHSFDPQNIARSNVFMRRYCLPNNNSQQMSCILWSPCWTMVCAVAETAICRVFFLLTIYILSDAGGHPTPLRQRMQVRNRCGPRASESPLLLTLHCRARGPLMLTHQGDVKSEWANPK